MFHIAVRHCISSFIFNVTHPSVPLSPHTLPLFPLRHPAESAQSRPEQFAIISWGNTPRPVRLSAPQTAPRRPLELYISHSPQNKQIQHSNGAALKYTRSYTSWCQQPVWDLFWISSSGWLIWVAHMSGCTVDHWDNCDIF